MAVSRKLWLRFAAAVCSTVSVAWAQTGSTLPTYNISTLAGNGTYGFAGDGQAVTQAQFSRPEQIALDSSGNLYVTDTGNNRIREITSASSGSSATINTIAGTGSVGVGTCDGAAVYGLNPKPIPALSANLDPNGVAVDASGTVYVSDRNNNCVRKVSGGTATAYAGPGTSNGNGDGGPPLLATVVQPGYLALDSSQNLFIAQSASVREIHSGVIYTVAPPTAQLYVSVTGIAVDKSGTLYIVDGNRVVMLQGSSLVPVAGGGTSNNEDIPATSAALYTPTAIAFDSQGNLLIAGGCVIRRVSGGMIETIAGTPGDPFSCGFGGDSTPVSVGPATSAKLNQPGGIAVDPTSGIIYIADTGNNRIRMLTPTSGSGTTGGSCPVTSMIRSALGTLQPRATTPGITVRPATLPERAAAGTDQFMVTSDISCQWKATSAANWITGLTPASGGGAMTQVSFNFSANMSSNPRNGTITVTGSSTSGTAGGTGTVTVTQAGLPCDATFAPTSPVLAPSEGTSGKFNIMFQANDCPWEAISTATWLSVTSGLSGAGNGSIEYKAAANMATTPRVGGIVASFTPFLVLQEGAAAMPGCTATFSPAPPANVQAAAATGTIGVSFPTGAQNCAYNATASDSWITITSGVTGSGKGTVGYSLSANTATTARSGSIVISGQPYAILQAGAAAPPECIPTFAPGSPLSIPSGGGKGGFNVTFPTSSCGWTAASNMSWLTVLSGLSGTGNGAIGYSVAANATSAARTGTITVSGHSFTFNQAASASATACASGSSCPTVTSVISASDYGKSSSASPGSIVEVYGTGLANNSRGWTAQDFAGSNAPTALDGVSVNFNGQPGYVSYISPLQVNAQIPTTVPTGTVQVTVTNQQQTSAPYTMTLNPVQPGLLAPQSFIVNGNSYVVAFLPDGTYVLPPGAIAGLNSRQAKPGEAVSMYGIGLGMALDSSGQPIAGGQTAPDLSGLAGPVVVQYGDTPALVTYAGLAPGYVGLYQLNVVTPQVPDNDLVPLTFTLNGTSYQTLYTAVTGSSAAVR